MATRNTLFDLVMPETEIVYNIKVKEFNNASGGCVCQEGGVGGHLEHHQGKGEVDL